jgi:hypothetical protein
MAGVDVRGLCLSAWFSDVERGNTDIRDGIAVHRHRSRRDLQIFGMNAGQGFATYLEKMVHPKVFIGGGYANIDRLMLNSDRYRRGRRFFLTTRIPLSPAFSVLMFATQATDHAATNVPQQRLDIGIVLQRARSAAKDAPLLSARCGRYPTIRLS